jgi:hypothetical protein
VEHERPSFQKRGTSRARGRRRKGDGVNGTMLAGCPPTRRRDLVAACAPVGGPLSSSGEAVETCAPPGADDARAAAAARAKGVNVRNPGMAMA